MIKSCARAPANIAIVKYMGKKDGPEANIPENPSLSLTLDKLCSYAEVFLNPSGTGEPRWVPELPSLTSYDEPTTVPVLSGEGRARVLAHLMDCLRLGPAILARHGIAARAPEPELPIELRTANTFPQDSGIASSASSFAAVTLAAVSVTVENPSAFAKAWEGSELRRDLSRLSRAGSGSSCRSFEGPWVLWDRDDGETIRTGLHELTDFVILVSDSPKKVSSSRAHALVKTSPLWASRPERARERLQRTRDAVASGDLRVLAHEAWAEAWEMHSLFHTAAEPFSYWEPGTVGALHFLARFLKDEFPPIVTLDAGPNVHLLVDSARAAEWRAILGDRFGEDKLLEDRQGRGASWMGGV